MKWIHTDSPVKKKFLGSAVSKEGHADSLLGYKRNDMDFLEKGATINSAYCQLFR